MSKVTFEFDGIEENDEVQFVAHRYDIRSTLYELQDYRRNLYKHETRGEMPVNEIIEKLDIILEDVNKLLD